MSHNFVHLHVHSHYSLLDGLSRIEELAQTAASYGQPAIAITDHGNLFGAIHFYKACKDAGIKPIIGMEAYVAPNSRFDKDKKKGEKSFHHITLLAATNEGYQNLLKLSTIGYLEGFYYKPRIDLECLNAHSNGIVCLSGCLSSKVATSILGGSDGYAEASHLREIFGRRFYLEVQRTNSKGQDLVLEAAIRLSKRLNSAIVATNDVHYTHSSDSIPHEALLCIGTGTNIYNKDRFKFDSNEYYLKETSQMVALFRDIPSAIRTTIEIAEQCNIEIDTSPKHIKYKDADASKEIERLSRIGMQSIEWWDNAHQTRLDSELRTIQNLGLSDYILVVYDIIRFAKERGIAIGGGRGSSAGSLVCYLLGITGIDPITHGLMFERFINSDRVSPPDIDIDVAPSGRQEVIDYIRNKYGADNVVQIATFGTLKTKQVVRDCARVLQLKWGAGDAISKEIPDIWVDLTIDDALKLPGFIRQIKYWLPDETQRNEFLNICRRLEGKVRHVSTHAAGVIIADQPIFNLVPLCTSKDEQYLSQFDMHSCEYIGLAKFDILGLRAVSCIEEACKLSGVEKNEIPTDDRQTFELLKRGQTVGVFQCEGQSITKFIRDFQPERFSDIVCINALFRPGPLDSGMARLYCERRLDRDRSWERERSIHPSIKEITKDTFGIFVFQEQVMQLAIEVAGFTPSEADTLRKAIGKKDKELMDATRRNFVKGSMANGLSRTDAFDLFHQVETFARYGWNKSHSVVYGLVTYHTAYLKCHYPSEFFTALLNQEDDKDRQDFLIQEAKLHGAKVVRPQINISDEKFVFRNRKIYQGLSSIKGCGSKTCQEIIKIRQESGLFTSDSDFRRRVPPKRVNSKLFETLVNSGAFRNTQSSITIDISNLNKDDLTSLSLACMLSAGDYDLFLKSGSTIFKAGMSVSASPSLLSTVYQLVGVHSVSMEEEDAHSISQRSNSP